MEKTEMGLIIHEERIKKGMTMEQLANQLGVGRSAINKWEKGYVQNIKRSTIKKLAEIFGVTPAYLMGYETFETAAEFEKKWNDLGGGRHPIDLSDDEYSLIINLRSCDSTESQKNRLLEYALKLGGQKK